MRLHTAAPELLDALTALVAAIEAVHRDGDTPAPATVRRFQDALDGAVGLLTALHEHGIALPTPPEPESEPEDLP